MDVFLGMYRFDNSMWSVDRGILVSPSTTSLSEAALRGCLKIGKSMTGRPRRVQGYQLCTQACGILDLNEARDAFLSSLCDFTLSAVDESSLQAATSGLDVTSPSSAKGALPISTGVALPQCKPCAVTAARANKTLYGR